MSAIMIFLVVSVTVGAEVASDRATRHDSRLQGLGLSGRGSDLIKNRPSPGLACNFSDLQISETTAPARFDQDHGRIVNLPGGGWLTVWTDSRLGSKKIFAQEFESSGSTVDANFMMAGSSIGSDFVDPVLRVDSLGRIYLVYRDQTAGLIVGARYDADLTVDLGPFLINDTSLQSFAGPFDFDVYPDGRMVVAWENYSPVGSTIEMRIYSSTGAELLSPTTVNSNPGIANHWEPSVAVRPGGGYLVVWEDYRNGRADIYGRLFDGNGDAVGGDFAVVPPPDDAADQYSPKVTYSESHDYVIGWVDRRAGQDVYVQQFDPTLGLVGANSLISDSAGGVLSLDVALATAADGSVLACWASFAATSDILAASLDTGMQVIGGLRSISSGSTGQRWGPAVAFEPTGGFTALWTDNQDGAPDLSLMVFGSDGTPQLPSELRINDDSEGAPSIDPCIASYADRIFLIGYQDERNDGGDIYLRAVSNAGVPQTAGRLANQDSGLNLQSEPALAAAPGKGLMVWLDSRPVGGQSGQRVYGRFASVLGGFISDEFMVSDSLEWGLKSGPKTTLTSFGSGLVAWIDRRSESPQVYGQWLTPAGTLDGGDMLISDPFEDLDNDDLYLCRDGSDHVYAIWTDRGSGVAVVKGRWYSADRLDSGSFSWVPETPGLDISDMAAAVNGAGEVSIFYTGLSSGTTSLYLAVIDRTGTVVTNSFEVTDNASAAPAEPAIAIGDHDHTSLTWVDRREGTRRVYYQLLDDLLMPIGDNQPISSAAVEFMQTPATYAYRGHAWVVWVDPRQDGLNVYAANKFYLPTDVTDPRDPSLPGGYRLMQNYPNPFNPSTAITFSLPRRAEISLSVYNLLGQKVAVIAEGVHAAGEHRVEWDGTDENGRQVASGVYLYRLEAGGRYLAQKMILLK